MVKKKKTSSTDKASETKITKIKATEEKPEVVKKTPAKTTKILKKDKKSKTKKIKSIRKALFSPFKAFGRYLKGAWVELKLVHWPNRKATWSLTAAVIGFTAFFVVLIILLDALFNYLLKLILG